MDYLVIDPIIDGGAESFHFLDMSFETPKFLILLESNISVFYLVIHAFGVILKNPLPKKTTTKNPLHNQGNEDLHLCYI